MEPTTSSSLPLFQFGSSASSQSSPASGYLSAAASSSSSSSSAARSNPFWNVDPLPEFTAADLDELNAANNNGEPTLSSSAAATRSVTADYLFPSSSAAVPADSESFFEAPLLPPDLPPFSSQPFQSGAFPLYVRDRSLPPAYYGSLPAATSSSSSSFAPAAADSDPFPMGSPHARHGDLSQPWQTGSAVVDSRFGPLLDGAYPPPPPFGTTFGAGGLAWNISAHSGSDTQPGSSASAASSTPLSPRYASPADLLPSSAFSSSSSSSSSAAAAGSGPRFRKIEVYNAGTGRLEEEDVDTDVFATLETVRSREEGCCAKIFHYLCQKIYEFAIWLLNGCCCGSSRNREDEEVVLFHHKDRSREGTVDTEAALHGAAAPSFGSHPSGDDVNLLSVRHPHYHHRQRVEEDSSLV